jgi:hypothetical protein
MDSSHDATPREAVKMERVTQFSNKKRNKPVSNACFLNREDDQSLNSPQKGAGGSSESAGGGIRTLIY